MIHTIPRVAWDALDAAFREEPGWRVKVAAAVRQCKPSAHEGGET